jgi:hypothetical protein
MTGYSTHLLAVYYDKGVCDAFVSPTLSNHAHGAAKQAKSTL